MHNVLEYQDGATFFGSSGGWQEKVEMGRGRSFGLEILAQKTIGKTTGWLGYTIAKSDRQFKDGTVNNGERFPYKYDRRHNINLCVNHKSIGNEIGEDDSRCTYCSICVKEAFAAKPS